MDTVITVNHRVCHSPTFSSFLALKRQLHDPSWNHHERQWSVQSWLEVSSSHVCLASKNLMGRCTNTKWEYQVTNMPSIGDWASNWKKNQLRKYAPVYRRIAIPVLGLQWIMKKKMQTPPWVEPNTGNHPGLRPKLGGLPAGPIVGPCWSQTSTDQWFFHGVSPLVLGSSSRSLDVKTAKTAMDWIGCFPHHQKGPISAPENRPGKAPGWIQRPEKRQGAKT